MNGEKASAVRASNTDESWNFLGYLDEYGDQEFSDENPINEVDAAIFAEIIVANVPEAIPEVFGYDGAIAFSSMVRAYKERKLNEGDPTSNYEHILEKVAESKRFGDVKIGNRAHEIGDDHTMTAATYYLPNGETHVTFRGADENWQSWEESARFLYEEETPGQLKAKEYLEKVAESAPEDNKISVSGISKGGNLAVYAATFAEPEARNRVSQVFTFDDIGHNERITAKQEFRDILPKVRRFVPEGYFVGRVLQNKDPEKIIPSFETGAYIHDPYSWRVNIDDKAFDTVYNETLSHKILGSAIDTLSIHTTIEDREAVVESVLVIIEKSGFLDGGSSPKERANQLFEAVKEFRSRSEEERRATYRLLRKTLAVTSRAAIDHFKKTN